MRSRLLIGLALLTIACDGGGDDRARLRVRDALAGDATAGFERALEPRSFDFPRDHGPHSGFRSEWWYFTGNLDGSDGARFGFQLTFFRNALTPVAPPRDSAWASNQVWMAHFALTDVSSHKFRSFERLARGSVGLAGAQHAPFRVWLENWSAASTASEFLPLRIRVGEEDVALDLELRSEKPIVLQGDRGLSRKSATVGNASYYYSLTRLGAKGKLSIGGREVAVRGNAWMDREWSTSALAEDQVGWDWFALQLNDDTELMFYQLRREDGSADPASAGSLVAADGTLQRLRRSDVDLRVLASWRSPHTGTSYPARWRLRVPAKGIDIEIEPFLADQEWHGTFDYWEGAVRVAGASEGRPIAGRGYVELTGYAGAARRGRDR